MKLVVISPEAEPADELAVLDRLFAAGLERYHVRKPAWSRAKLESWLREVPVQLRSRLVLHQHHELVPEFGLGGVHWRDVIERGTGVSPVFGKSHGRDARATFISRSCHDLATLRAAFGCYDSVFFSPVFPSISKPGYGPRADVSIEEIASLLAARSAPDRRTTVLALGGITAERGPEIRALGFDGMAVMGAIWSAPNPVRAFTELQESLCCHAA